MLVAGDLPPDQRARVADHAASCRACHDLVAVLVTQHGAKAHYGAGVLQLGAVIGGRFRIDDILGIGGMGIVVAATHLELGTRVAMKFMREEMLGKADIGERFVREARAVVRLRTEHVCKVLDVARLDSGAPYIVMELLEGTDLSRTIVRQPLPMTIAVEYVMQACVALAEAHGLGIVHRDLKPANLFVTRGAHGRPLVKVLDFGIAKAMFDNAAALTMTRAMLGSPGYMSPEQVASARSVDARSDIWALGVTLYQLLSGRMPFVAPTPTALAIKIAFEPAAPLGGDPALAAIVGRCLDKAPERRYADVAALAAELVPFGGPAARRIAAAVSARPGQPSRGSPPAVRSAITPSAPVAQLVSGTAATLAAGAMAATQATGVMPGAMAATQATGVTPGTAGVFVATGGPTPGPTGWEPARRSRAWRAGVVAGLLGFVIAVVVVTTRGRGAGGAAPGSIASVPPAAPAGAGVARGSGGARDAAPAPRDAGLGTIERLLASDAGVAPVRPARRDGGAARRETVILRGPIDDPPVREAVQSHTAEVRRCYEAYGGAGGKQVKLRVVFTLGVDGRATEVAVAGVAGGIATCVAGVVRDAVLPPPVRGPVRVEVPLAFTAELRPPLTSAAPPVAAPPRGSAAPPVAAPPPVRESLTNDELMTGLRMIEPRLMQCATHHNLHRVKRRVMVAVEPSGKGSSLRLEGPERGTELERCLSWVARDGRWSATRSGGAISVELEFP
jgi:eukaryotic-like serine/threonine-protein kinase